MVNKNNLFNVTRLKEEFPGYKKIMLRHREAVEKNEDFYIDPGTGLTVFTALYLFNRGYCCGSGCRHCPYTNIGEDGER
ncbi:MAG: DUF5522 domain-containing protein [Ignavibacteria bacterium]